MKNPELNLTPSYRKPRLTCKRCGQVEAIVGRGLCGRCWHAAKVAGTLADWPKQVRGAVDRGQRAVGGGVAAPAEAAPGAENLALSFGGRDLSLLRRLKAVAVERRRTPEAQILWVLEHCLRDDDGALEGAA